MPKTRFFCTVCGTALKAAAESPHDFVECPSCSHVVPVPGPLEIPGQPVTRSHVFPPDVLALEVKFLCGACKNKLRADARWEGRSIKCPVCSEKSRVPRWSRPAEEKIVPLRPPPTVAPARTGLSVAEVEFLSEAAVVRPRMAG